MHGSSCGVDGWVQGVNSACEYSTRTKVPMAILRCFDYILSHVLFVLGFDLMPRSMHIVDDGAKGLEHTVTDKGGVERVELGRVTMKTSMNLLRPFAEALCRSSRQ